MVEYLNSIYRAAVLNTGDRQPFGHLHVQRCLDFALCDLLLQINDEIMRNYYNGISTRIKTLPYTGLKRIQHITVHA